MAALFGGSGSGSGLKKKPSHRTIAARNRLEHYLKYFNGCDDWEKWSSLEENYPDGSSGEVHVYLTRGPEDQEGEEALAAFSRTVGVELDEALNVTEVMKGTPAEDAGVRSGPPTERKKTHAGERGMKLTRICGGDVRDMKDVARVWADVIPGHNFTVSFEVRVEIRLRAHHKAHYDYADPTAAYHDSEDHFDACIRAALGFDMTPSLKVSFVKEKHLKRRRLDYKEPQNGDEDVFMHDLRTAATKAGIEKGMVLRAVDGVTIHNLRDYRTKMLEAYERAGREKVGGGGGHSPDIDVELVFTRQGEDAGERTARSFHELCGEQSWKGCSTVYIDAYDELRDSCGWITNPCREDEDDMLVDYKRLLSIFFARRYAHAINETKAVEHPNADLMSEAPSKSATATRSAIDTERLIAPGATGKQQMATQTTQKQQAKKRIRGANAQEQADMRGFLSFMDAYGHYTLKFIEARQAEEVSAQSQARVLIFYGTVSQFVLSLVVFAVGAEEMPPNGGKFAPFIATTIAACVGVIAAIIGFLGALGGGAEVKPGDEHKTGADMPNLGEPNEGYLQRFMACNYWLLSVLTTFLYSEIIELDEYETQCSSTNAGAVATATANCALDKGRHTVLIIISGIMLAVVLLCTLFATDLLDSVNDKTKIDQKGFLLEYFRVRMFEAKYFMQEHMGEYVANNYYELLDNDVLEDADASGGPRGLRDRVPSMGSRTASRRGSAVIPRAHQT
eukprot:TRINITY_DN3329_c1_g1_i1.p1 TRINITY_DN3329_c1_g1~~TRINITY_DN3329_c1_g1_i1.p1  ORF type:complete len:734 (+),score=270.39 TRINITY_DN3329_c1_g1_i1:100-2301(+)